MIILINQGMRANSVGGGKSFLSDQKASLGKRPSQESDDPSVLQGSSMQKSSPIQRPRTPRSSPAKISLTKTPSKSAFTADSVENSPSPTKIAKAVSMFNHSVGEPLVISALPSSAQVVYIRCLRDG